MTKVLHRGKLSILVEDKRIIVYDHIQATLYAPYLSPYNHLFGQMKDFLLTSENTEYGSWLEILELAQACRVYGQGVKKPLDTNA